MSLTKVCMPSETALRQLFNRQLFGICVLSLNGRMAPNSAVSHEFVIEKILKMILPNLHSDIEMFL